MNVITNNSILNDDEDIKKANSVQWFDNQAGAVEWMKPKKKLSLPARQNLDLNSMSFEELSNLYDSMFEKLHVLNSLPSELRAEQKESTKKTIAFTVAIKIAMRKKANDEQKEEFNEHERTRRSEQVEKLKSIQTGLHKKIEKLTRELEQLKNSKSKTMKIERMKIASNRDNVIHFYFKKIIKEEIGELLYLDLINKANELADAQLEEIKKQSELVDL